MLKNNDYEDDQFELSRYKWIIPAVIVIILISAFLSRCNSIDNLKGYTGDVSSLDTSSESSLGDSSEEEPIKLSEETYKYKDDKYNYSIELPESWSKVNGIQDSVSFISKKDSTQITITVNDYDPMVNSINEDYIYQQHSEGIRIKEFSKKSNSEYAITYSDNDYGYIEYVYWDYDTIIKLTFTVNLQNYNNTNINNTIKYINNSFVWNREHSIPEDLNMVYISYGDFEFGYPKGWNYGESENAIMTTNEEGSAAFSITINESNSTLEGISQVDYSNYLSQTKPNFMLKSFNNTGTFISCTGTYVQNDVQLNVQQYIFVNGNYEYILSFDTEAQVTADLTTTIQEVINSFRYFSSAQESTESDLEQGDNENQTEQTENEQTSNETTQDPNVQQQQVQQDANIPESIQQSDTQIAMP